MASVLSTTGDTLDPGAVAAALSAEYDTIDSSLILAILSDYQPENLAQHLDEIRDQLGILQACAVVDAADAANAYAEDAESVGGLADQLNEALRASARDAEVDAGADADVGDWVTYTATSSSALSGSGSGSGSSKSTTPTSVHEDEWSEVDWEDEVDVLKSLFPNQSEEELQKAYTDALSLQSAIDELLALETIRHAEEHDLWPEDVEETHGASATSDGEWEATGTSKSTPMSRTASETSRSSKKSRKTTKTIPIVDTLQRRAPTAPNPLKGRSPNAWHTLASVAAHLADLLPPHPASYFSSHLHSPDNRSAHAAIRAALLPLPTKSTSTGGPTEQILQDLFGLALLPGELGKKKQADLRLAIRVGGEDIGVVMDLVDVLNEVAMWPGDEEEWTDDETAWQAPKTVVRASAPVLASTPVVDLPSRMATLRNKKIQAKDNKEERVIPGAQTPLSALSSPLARDDFGKSSPTPDVMPKRAALSRGGDGKQVHPQNWRKVTHTRPDRQTKLHPYASHIPSYAKGQTPHDRSSGALYRSSGYSVDQCLSRAAAERERREEAIRAVGRHFAGHLPGGKSINASVAGHYAAQARAAQTNARDWELQAARMVVEQQLDRTRHTVDLHHLTVDEARTVAVEAADRWWRMSKDRDGERGRVTIVPSTPLTVITGVGRHSVGNKGVLGPAVAAELERAGWRVERGDSGRGYLCVKGKK